MKSKTFVYMLFFAALMFTSGTQATTSRLEFKVVPPKTIQAGKSALMILPVRIMDTSCSYKITTKGIPEYPVMAPESIEAKSESVIEYLPFSVQIPSNAPTGQIYVMKVRFIPDTNCSDQNVLETELAVKIQAYEDLSFDNTGNKTTITSAATQFDLLLKNSGNTDLNLSLSIENLTPSVRVTLKQTAIKLKAQETKNAQIAVDFSASGADFASFKVIATANGQRFLSKNFQIRFLKNINTGTDQRSLQSQFYFSNDFISEGANRAHTTAVGGNISGELSDYYALSAYFQSLYLQGENESTQYELSLEKHDNFKIKLGSSLNASDVSLPGVRHLAGISASKQLLQDFEVGIYGGIDQTNADHIGTFADWNRGYQSRWIVYYDRNNKTNANSYGVSGQEHFRVNESIAIAPSLILAQDELRGQYSRIGANLSAIASKHFPLQVEVVREEDNRYTLERASTSLNYSYKAINVNVGLSADKIKAKTNELDLMDGRYDEAYLRVMFPVSSVIQGQATIKYQSAPDGKKGLSPELMLTASKNQWRAFVRVGEQQTKNSQSILNNVNGADLLATSREQYAQGNLEYAVSPKLILQLSADYMKADQNYNRYSADIGAVYKLDDDRSYLKGTLRTSYDNNAFSNNRTHSADLTYYKKFSKNWSMETTASASYHDDLGKKDYAIMTKLTWSPHVPVSKKVEDVFGGKSTGEVSGKVCLDYNENGKCDAGDKFLKNVELRLGSRIEYTNTNGDYLMTSIQPGYYVLDATRNTLPPEANSANIAQSFELYANDRVKKDIALKWIGQIRAIVFEDKNGDGIWQNEKESQLPDVELSLTGAGVDLKTKSSSTKPSVFTNLKKGEYVVEISRPLAHSTVTTNGKGRIKLPEQNGSYVYLGLSFEQGTDDTDLDILVTLEDSLIFSNDMRVNFLVEDPNFKIKTLSLSCGDKLIKASQFAGHDSTAFDWNVNISKCQRLSKSDLIILSLNIETTNGQKLDLRKFEIIVK